MNVDPTGSVFGALADGTRRDLLRSISSHPATATELAGAMPISRQAVVKHLGTLSDAGLVQGQRSGREVRYQLTPEPLAEVMSWMAEVGAEWDGRLARLRDRLEPR